MWIVILLSVFLVFGLAGWFLPVTVLIALSVVGAGIAAYGFRYAGKNDNGSGGIAYGWSFLTCAAVVVGWIAFGIERYWS